MLSELMSRSRFRTFAADGAGLPVTQNAGAGSEWIAKVWVSLRCVASRPGRFTVTSDRVVYEHVLPGAPVQPAGVGALPEKWSPSSVVTENSVFFGVMPSLARRARKVPNAVS